LIDLDLASAPSILQHYDRGLRRRLNADDRRHTIRRRRDRVAAYVVRLSSLSRAPDALDLADVFPVESLQRIAL